MKKKEHKNNNFIKTLSGGINYLLDRLSLLLTAALLVILVSISLEYLFDPPEYVSDKFSQRIEDVRNIGLAVGGIFGAFVLVWRARSHNIQAKSSELQFKKDQLDYNTKVLDHNHQQLSSIIEGLNDKNLSKKTAALFKIEPVLKYFAESFRNDEDSTTILRIIDILPRNFEYNVKLCLKNTVYSIDKYKKNKFTDENFSWIIFNYEFLNVLFNAARSLEDIAPVTIRNIDFEILFVKYDPTGLVSQKIKNLTFHNCIFMGGMKAENSKFYNCRIDNLTISNCSVSECLSSYLTAKNSIVNNSYIYKISLESVTEVNNCHIGGLQIHKSITIRSAMSKFKNNTIRKFTIDLEQLSKTLEEDNQNKNKANRFIEPDAFDKEYGKYNPIIP